MRITSNRCALRCCITVFSGCLSLIVHDLALCIVTLLLRWHMSISASLSRVYVDAE